MVLTLGLRREDKAREMRSPLSPEHVRSLVSAYGVRVLVERSAVRVFEDGLYAAAGAELVDGGCGALAAAHVIVGVKEIPSAALVRGQTVCCFAHVIKAQPGGMALLDALLTTRARLVDYEAITEGGTRGGTRKVAFGRHAGIAGAIDVLRGLGERLLTSKSVATPFLGVAATWQYPSLDAAFAAVAVAGASIRVHGLPRGVSPLIIAITGLHGEGGVGGGPSGGGRVANGAREVLELLPLRWVSPRDLPALLALGDTADAHCVYAVAIDVDDMVERGCETHKTNLNDPLVETSWTPAPPIDRGHYKASPDEYRGTFHRRIAPFISLLLHCSYWEPRYPRLLTSAQAAALAAANQLRLLAVSDISCDVNGAVDFMRPTTMGAPFFIHDAITETPIFGDISASPENGILYTAVDHLPSECPRDASIHFGDCLLPLLPPLLSFCAREREAEGVRCGGHGLTTSTSATNDAALSAVSDVALPPEIRGAVVVENGSLTSQWAHVASLREAQERAEQSRSALRLTRPSSPSPSSPPRHSSSLSATIELVGHVFDTGLINSLLDAVEAAHAASEILNCNVGRARDADTRLSLLLLAPEGEISASAAALNALVARVRSLAVAAGVKVRVVGGGVDSGDVAAALDKLEAAETPTPRTLALTTDKPPTARAERILVFGAGFVSAPCIDSLLRRPRASVTIASPFLQEAEILSSPRAPRARAVICDVGGDAAALLALVAAHDIVVSLVPAPLHPSVARACIAARVPMVTSSYVSPALTELHAEAIAAGITIVNECGLDPGIDHMTVARMIATVKAEGGAVTRFASVCGGLPAPEAADNPLGYKWSWSPRGSLAAMGNGARFLADGVETVIEPGSLLGAVRPFRLAAFPGFALEVLPNRDAMPYQEAYGAKGALLTDFSRGTLRFQGFSQILGLLVAAGALDAVAAPVPAGCGGGGGGGGVGGGGGTPPPTLARLLGGLLGVKGPMPSASELATAACAAAVDAAPRVPPPPSAAAALAFFEWLPLNSPAPLVLGAVKEGGDTFLPLDTLANALAGYSGMAIKTGERDMVLMQHEMTVEFPGSTRAAEIHISALVAFAEGGVTAMARTVGLTAAAAASMILDKKAPVGAGVVTPVGREWYDYILSALEKDNIKMVETVSLVA